MDISEKLSELRRMGFSQAAIGAETGISQATISRIESGEHTDPRTSTSKAIDEFFQRACACKKEAA